MGKSLHEQVYEKLGETLLAAMGDRPVETTELVALAQIYFEYVNYFES